ncbi:unnamed protein product [Rotaria socialis]|nr:unnamed protein product [Rotaria socialis]CAF3469229.1 unnamed protein product [Rotaria socialis]CAF3604489.1 unnamed protein product [Rotaria socialis]CAF3728806.1 unnamed protein product [Rotaria socialis]
MVKLLPVQYHIVLGEAYWGKEWKTARTICLNKNDNPAPTTNQLRPISMLPTFSKIYEKLFLLRFHSWFSRMNIYPFNNQVQELIKRQYFESTTY